jgi:isocitrate/isopropylmalate dehydrogenase
VDVLGFEIVCSKCQAPLRLIAGERYKRTGEILPDSALEEFKNFDSIFVGAMGHPDVKPGILEVGILLKTRVALDQYINLRPVKLITDLAAIIQGGLGIAAGGNINPGWRWCGWCAGGA